MMTKRWITTTIGLAALASALSGSAAYAAGGATVTDASGPTYLYGTANPLAGAQFEIHGVQTPSGRTIVTLHATGLDPSLAGRTFGAHVHQFACDANSAGAAGGHYKKDTTVATAVEDNEIWLDFTVGPDGQGHARAERSWTFSGPANSVVAHLNGSTTAGSNPRLACTDAVFHA